MENQGLHSKSIVDTLIHASRKNKGDVSFTYLELLAAASAAANLAGISGATQAEHLAKMQDTAKVISGAMVEAFNGYKSKN